MTQLAYVDSSCLVAIAFEEPGAEELAKRLDTYDRLFSSNLLEAEYRAALVREEVENGEDLLSSVTWVFPDRPLSDEISRVTAHGYVKGADLWHLACALYLAGEDCSQLIFETLDHRQGEVAASLGFPSSVEAPADVERASAPTAGSDEAGAPGPPPAEPDAGPGADTLQGSPSGAGAPEQSSLIEEDRGLDVAGPESEGPQVLDAGGDQKPEVAAGQADQAAVDRD